MFIVMQLLPTDKILYSILRTHELKKYQKTDVEFYLAYPKNQSHAGDNMSMKIVGEIIRNCRYLLLHSTKKASTIKRNVQAETCLKQLSTVVDKTYYDKSAGWCPFQIFRLCRIPSSSRILYCGQS